MPWTPRARPPRPRVLFQEEWMKGLSESDFEKSIRFAARRNNPEYITGIIRNKAYILTDEERDLLADLIDGFFKNPRGRPSNLRLLPSERDARKTPIMRAAELAKSDFASLRASGAPWRGGKERCIEIRAKEFGVSVDQVANAYERSTRDRKKRPRKNP